MPTTIQITTDNYDGQTAVITFTPDNGGPVVNLGSQVLPYDYNAEYVYGTYSLYFPLFDTTCTLVIENETILMCFQYVGLNFPNPTQLYICNIESDLSTWNGRNYWVLSICVNIPECSYVDVGVVWWDISSSSWIHSMVLGDMGVAFSSLSNPGIYPIQVTGVYEWVNLLPGCTCCPSLVDSSLGLCVTVTPTPTITPTMTPTPTPTPTPTKQYYVYKLCGDAKIAYVVQTQPGLTTTPGKVIRTTLDEYCWEFLYQTTNPNPIPPAPFVQIINFDGNYLTPVSEEIFDNCTDCSLYVPTPINCNFTVQTTVLLASILNVTPTSFYGETIGCFNLIGPAFPVTSIISSSFTQFGYSGNISVVINTAYGTTTSTTLSLSVNNNTIQSVTIPSLGGGSSTSYGFSGVSFLSTDTVKILWA
jgi:hypothetical protein